MYEQVELEVVSCGTFFPVSRIRLTEKSYLSLFRGKIRSFGDCTLETIGYIDEFNTLLYNRFSNESISSGIVRVVNYDYSLKLTNIPECSYRLDFLTIEVPESSIRLSEISFKKIISFVED